MNYSCARVSAKQVSGAELLVQCLEAQDIDHVFVVPGESYRAVLDVLVDAPSAISTRVCRQKIGNKWRKS